VADDGREIPHPGDVPVFVLVGGEGTRLRDSWSGPKALVPVEGRPFLGYLLDELEGAGFGRIILLTGRGASEVEEAFRERNLVSLREPRPLGTGGALRAAAPLAGAWNIVLNGDSLCRIPWGEFLSHAADRPFRLCVAASKVDEARSFGTLEVDPDGRVVAFREKGGSGSRLVNAGVYAARREFFRTDLPEESGHDPLSLETQVLPVMARDGALGAWITEEPFWDVGTPERLTIFQEKIRKESRE
jgi:NDP-sugar pyrophosphorylase family protein